jgi:hypothetical protein
VAEELSRRKVLKTGAIGIVAGVAALSGVGRLGALPGLQAPESEPDLSALGDDVVAHIRDASTGEVSIMVGTSEIVHRDPQLVGRLLAVARQANQEG